MTQPKEQTEAEEIHRALNLTEHRRIQSLCVRVRTPPCDRKSQQPGRKVLIFRDTVGAVTWQELWLQQISNKAHELFINLRHPSRAHRPHTADPELLSSACRGSFRFNTSAAPSQLPTYGTTSYLTPLPKVVLLCTALPSPCSRLH